MCESLYGKLINTLATSDLERKCQLLGLSTGILRKSPHVLKASHSATILGWVQKISADDNITAENLKKAKAFFTSVQIVSVIVCVYASKLAC